MGNKFREQKSMARAAENYEKSLEYEFSRDISLLLVTHFIEAKNYTKANNHIKNMLANNPEDEDAIYNRAEMLYAQGKFEEARADFQKFVHHATYGKRAGNVIQIIDVKSQ
jgi:tetratricopeptide (TPR) repeat protein